MYTVILNRLENLAKNHVEKQVELETQERKEEIRDKAKQGKYLGGTLPFGYKMHSGRVMIESYTAEIVRLIFEAYLAGSTIEEIAKGLNCLQIPTPSDFSESRKEGVTEYKVKKSRNWSKSTVNRILKNTIYMGEIIYGKQTRNQEGKRVPWDNEVAIIDADNLAIIQKDKFIKVQTILILNRIK